MRRIASSLVVIALGCVVAASSAEPPKIAPTVKLPTPNPTIVPGKISLPPYIASAKKSGSPGYANDAPLSFEVEVVNGTSTPLDTNLVVTQLIPTASRTPTEAGQVARVPVRVAANSRATITYESAKGLIDGCTPNYHRLALENGSSKILKITPACIFGATPTNPEQGALPDRIVGMRENKVSYHTPELARRRAECGIPFKMEATTQNKTNGPVTGVNIRIVGPGGEGTSYEPAKFALAPNASRRVDALSVPFNGQPGRWTLKLGADLDAGRIHQMNFAANVTRLCSIQTELTDAVTPLPSPAPQRGE
jgi:hypothetical protein